MVYDPVMIEMEDIVVRILSPRLREGHYGVICRSKAQSRAILADIRAMFQNLGPMYENRYVFDLQGGHFSVKQRFHFHFYHSGNLEYMRGHYFDDVITATTHELEPYQIDLITTRVRNIDAATNLYETLYRRMRNGQRPISFG